MTSPPGLALFDTALGRCGIAWNGRGVLAVQLPEAREGETRARLQRRAPQAREAAPPRAVKQALGGIVALLRGRAVDLSDVPLDMEGVPPFHRRVYEATRKIPPGATLSYGELAARAGRPGAARAVGQALRSNPFAIVVPCHRVLAAGGRLGGFSANGGLDTKRRLLTLEGTHLPERPARRARRAKPGFDPRAAVRFLRSADPALGRLIDAVGPLGLEVGRAPTLFASLARAIVYQQLHGRAAATIHARLCALLAEGAGAFTPEQLLGASDAALRGAGLSRAKSLALRDLARRTVTGELPTLEQARRMEDGEIVEALVRVRGIGRWTAQMLLIFQLGRPDVLPADDYGVRKGFAAAYRKRALPEPRALERYAERWRPYRTAASWYLWRAAERARG